jgi:hypothetical protein
MKQLLGKTYYISHLLTLQTVCEFPGKLNLLFYNAVLTFKISMLNRKYLAILNFKSLVHTYWRVKCKANVIVHETYVIITKNLNPLIQA